MALPALPMLLAATAVQAVGQVVGGYSQAAGLRGQANAFDASASIADANARVASEQAGLREEQVRREARQEISAQRVSAATSGTGMGGSNLDMIRQNQTYAALDALNTRYEGALRRTSFENEASGLRHSAKQARSSAKGAVIGGWLGAAGSALSSGSQYLSAGGRIPGWQTPGFGKGA